MLKCVGGRLLRVRLDESMYILSSAAFLGAATYILEQNTRNYSEYYVCVIHTAHTQSYYKRIHILRAHEIIVQSAESEHGLSIWRCQQRKCMLQTNHIRGVGEARVQATQRSPHRTGAEEECIIGSTRTQSHTIVMLISNMYAYFADSRLLLMLLLLCCCCCCMSRAYGTRNRSHWLLFHPLPHLQTFNIHLQQPSSYCVQFNNCFRTSRQIE